MNIVGIVLAATGKWQYPRHYTGACVLGNLLVAILMRNELFCRLLYLVVNTCFAKVVYHQLPFILYSDGILVAPFTLPPCLYLCSPASRWYTFWLCNIGIYVAYIPRDYNLHRPQAHA